jgi:type IX secretion system PorP/SprF family membrane protein
MKTFYFLLLCLVAGPALAQDPQFTQGTFATPLYLNPAFAGNTESVRANVLFRNQFSNLDNPYNTIMASADYNMKEYNGGAGLMLLHDQSGQYTSTSATASFSYRAKFNANTSLLLGLSGSFYSKRLDPVQVVFRDQLRIDTDQIGRTRETFGNLTFNFPSFAAGAILSSRKFWLGLAMNHLNTPRRSLVGDTPLLPLKLTMHGGLNLLTLNKNREPTDLGAYPSFVFRRQGPVNQLDLGINIGQHQVRNMGFGYILGFWYRGMFAQKTVADQFNRDAVSVLGGLTLGNLTFNYSYDLTISGLAPYNTGTHEVSVIFELHRSKSSQRLGGLANPVYGHRVPGKKRKQ